AVAYVVLEDAVQPTGELRTARAAELVEAAQTLEQRRLHEVRGAHLGAQPRADRRARRLDQLRARRLEQIAERGAVTGAREPEAAGEARIGIGACGHAPPRYAERGAG